jgi:hypothetical protein
LCALYISQEEVVGKETAGQDVRLERSVAGNKAVPIVGAVINGMEEGLHGEVHRYLVGREFLA